MDIYSSDTKESGIDMKYRMYIDEVGNSDLGSSNNPLHRFLSLTGVIIDLDYVKSVVHPQMEDLKSRYFDSHPDDPFIFHRKKLVNAKYPFHALRDPNIYAKFDEELLNLLRDWRYYVVSVCLDKKTHKDTYRVWRYDSYHYCLALLLERFTFFLEQCNAVGDVMAEARGGKEDIRLKKSFAQLVKDGTEYIEPIRFQAVLTSGQLKVKPKTNNISGLQLADMIAHPSRNEILCDNNMLEGAIAPFARKIIEILQDKYYKRGEKIYGKKFI